MHNEYSSVVGNHHPSCIVALCRSAVSTLLLHTMRTYGGLNGSRGAQSLSGLGLARSVGIAGTIHSVGRIQWRTAVVRWPMSASDAVAHGPCRWTFSYRSAIFHTNIGDSGRGGALEWYANHFCLHNQSSWKTEHRKLKIQQHTWSPLVRAKSDCISAPLRWFLKLLTFSPAPFHSSHYAFWQLYDFVAHDYSVKTPF